MPWSKIKHRLENEYLAPSLRGRITYFATSYSKCPDHEGRAAILLDGEEIFKSSYYEKMMLHSEKFHELEKQGTGFHESWWQAFDEAEKAGGFDQKWFYYDFQKFDSQPIEESLKSEMPLIRIFALLDRRVGKRRLVSMKDDMESLPSFIKIFYKLRCEAEGIETPMKGNTDMKNIVVLVSGGGTNLQALIDSQERGEIKGGRISCVISSKEGAYALERAAKAGIPTVVLPRKDYADKVSYSMAIKEELDRQKADLVVLAGFMTILDECVTKAYNYKIINVHPALIPSFCGEGYYGLKVHEKALEYGVKVSGATIHFVNEQADAGAIILQGAVDIANDDTPETLQRKIMENVEWKLLPKAVSLFCEDRITIKDGKAYVDLK